MPTFGTGSDGLSDDLSIGEVLLKAASIPGNAERLEDLSAKAAESGEKDL